MSITNAISGMTAAGGLLILGGGYLPNSIPSFLAAIAVLISSFNIGGGFVVTHKMLEMFRRKGDPEEYNYLYSIPAAALVGSLLAGTALGFPNLA